MTAPAITHADPDAGLRESDIAREAGRSCTCHPDDNPPRPCPERYAYSECVEAAAPLSQGETATPTPDPVTAAEDRLREREAEIGVLKRFLDFLLKWRDRGPPHGDPETGWSVVSHHPVVRRHAEARAALAPTDPTPASSDEATR